MRSCWNLNPAEKAKHAPKIPHPMAKDTIPLKWPIVSPKCSVRNSITGGKYMINPINDSKYPSLLITFIRLYLGFQICIRVLNTSFGSLL